jgi:CRISPR-associated protein Cas1
VAASVEEARGLEGQGASVYFRAYGRLVGAPGFEFTHRVRRPPTDPVNAMLSFGYALLMSSVSTAVRSVGFDAHVGFLHYDRYGRESLSLDLMEEFRAPVVDALVAALVHKRVVGPGEFERDPTSCRLSKRARRGFIEQFERKLESELVHPVLGKRVSHRRAIEIQARLLAKHLTGELGRYVAFAKR